MCIRDRCTLRQIEQSEAVKKLCGDGIEEAVRHIVGVQFRNQATVGGSIYGRFGFSDVLTAFLALDTYVEPVSYTHQMCIRDSL